MSIFTIADLHLSTLEATNKSMEVFGNRWTDYTRRLEKNWKRLVSDGDTVGYAAGAKTDSDGSMDAWVPAMGISVTKMIDGYPELTFYDEHTVEAFEKLKALYRANPGSLCADGKTATSFIIGNQLFFRGDLNSGSGLRNMQDDYGVLPMPKFDEAQDDYYTTFANIASLIVVLSTCTDTAKVGATLELMAAEAYKQVTPAYFEICLQGKYSDTPEDAAMYDRILGGFVFSFGFCYSTKSLDGIGGLFRNIDRDIAQTYESNKVKYQTALETLIDKLDEVSFMLG